MTKILPKVRQNGFIKQELQDEILIYNLTTHKAHCLNKSMAHIWSFCDGKTTTDQVINSFKDKLQMDINEDFVWLAIDELAKADLLEANSQTYTDRISRRKALLQFALPLAMVPIISTIVAPTAAHAQSGGPGGGGGQSGGGCEPPDNPECTGG